MRPLFNQISKDTSIEGGFELLKELLDWSSTESSKDTLFCSIDVIDLYTMIPQVEGVLSLKKMIDYAKLKQVGGLKVETIVQMNTMSWKDWFLSRMTDVSVGI